jgi:hypothetical protein
MLNSYLNQIARFGCERVQQQSHFYCLHLGFRCRMLFGNLEGGGFAAGFDGGTPTFWTRGGGSSRCFGAGIRAGAGAFTDRLLTGDRRTVRCPISSLFHSDL